MSGRALALVRKNSLLARYSVTLGELTLRRQSELSMLAAKAESDLANRAKTTLLGTMSHELRTPLNAIIGFSDLIQSLGDGEDAREKSAGYAGQISRAGHHLLGMISDVLDMSKIESGTLGLTLDEHPLDDILYSAASIVAERIEAKGQRFDKRIPSGLPDLTVDARRLKQALVNLLSNAHKFTPEGGRITLTARANKDGGATIVIVDTGVGMTAEQIETALKPFAQVQSHYTRTEEGAGLGLPIADGIVRLMGGDLYLESEPGAGVAAVVTLRPGKARRGPASKGGGERRSPRKTANSARGKAA